jgi:hypothetical protein
LRGSNTLNGFHSEPRDLGVTLKHSKPNHRPLHCLALEKVTSVQPGRHWAPGFREPLSELDFGLCDLTRYRCHLGQDVTGQQTQRQPVRVVKHDYVVNYQVKC